MKSSVITMLMIIISGCSINQNKDLGDTLKIVESTILWEAQLEDSGGILVGMSKMLSDTNKYKKEGNFYSPLGNETVFGHKAIYFGTLGMGEMVGPNVTVEGSPKEISSYIAKKYKLTFEASPNKEAYRCNLKKHVILFVVKHPSLSNTSMVISAYTGP